MKKDARVYLVHMLERIKRIQAYIQPGRDAFFSEILIQDAVIRNLEIIGEAARKIGEDYRVAHPEFQWKGMTGLRNILIHDYEEVDLEKVWQLVTGELSPLKTAIEKILPPLDQLEKELAGEK